LSAVFVKSIIITSGGANSPLLVYTGAAVFLLWGIWAAVGIFRCGARNAFDKTNTTGRRIGGVAAVAGVVLVASLAAKDVSCSPLRRVRRLPTRSKSILLTFARRTMS
jgi:hypothetical protein